MARTLVAVAVAFAALGACSQKLSLPPEGAPGGGGVPPGPMGGGGPTDAGAGTCGLPGTPTDFTLPTTNIPVDALAATSGQAMCTNGSTFHWSLTDIDGDQQPDLVVDSACEDATIGTQAWRVYKNTGTGFADPVRFALPVPALDPKCTTQTFMDVDGDLKPDLLVTKSCVDPNVGTTRWLVYPNTPFGFGTPVDFALPTGFPTDAFTTTENDTLACPRPVYGFFDVDGDRKPDLVLTTACDDATVGSSTWRVYRNIGGGVAAPALITLPTKAGYTIGAFSTPKGAALGCATAQSIPHWQLVDFDGDFTPDIVVTQTCTDVTVGTSAWLLFRGSKTGFDASPTRVALPVLAGAPLQNAFVDLAANASCNGTTGEPGYTLLDVNSDFKPDLLVTRACGDMTTGISRWLVFPNSGTALATAPRTYSLPVALGGTVSEPLGLTATLSCTGTPRPAFSPHFLAGLHLDIVATTACHDTTVGTTKWQVFESSCP